MSDVVSVLVNVHSSISIPQFPCLKRNGTIDAGKQQFSWDQFCTLGDNPGKSRGRYLGIWYKKDDENSVARVANRNTPISDSVGFLSINTQGSLVLRMDSTNDIVWSSNASTNLQNPVAVLLESGNFVVKDENDNNPNNILWQSFDYPCDTLLLGMKLGKNLLVDPHGFSQLFLRKGPEIMYRAGSWNGLHWTGTPRLKPNSVYIYDFVSNEKEVFTHLTSKTDQSLQEWRCNINNYPDVCKCLEGFTPKSPREWKILDWNERCDRRAPLPCNHINGFLKHEALKLPDTSQSWAGKNISLVECEKLCLNNCSCTTYANLDVREGGAGCLLWFSDLFDIKTLELNGQDLYIRAAASESANIDPMRQPIAWRRKLSGKKRVIIIVTCVISAMGVLVLCGIIYMWKSKLGIQDPAPGQFSLWIDPQGFPQLILRNGSALRYRAGSWNGIHFTGTPMLNPNPEFLYQFELNKDEVYYEAADQGLLMSRLFLNQSGFIQRLVRSNQSKVLTRAYDAPEDQCEIYSFCGAHAACKTDSSSDEFRNYTGLKLPDTYNSTFNTSMSLQECKEKCLKNCSCTAYANSNISQEGSGCLLWFGNLTDMIRYGQGGQNFYIRMASKEKEDGNASVKKRVGIIVGSVISIAILLVALIFYIHKRKHKKQGHFITQSSICEGLVILVG
ncbi:hypothetical protein EZV62_008501 [Acer yangbiense]|uniref:Non-specific serine/threonine protein kinase n=1 Tax=Acer yangbiense TaxID=1000413 RepID=A0A5C7IFK5_9ROSI|nr:hypothetical protein EZV62_008501 [Acer yangbiense]